MTKEALLQFDGPVAGGDVAVDRAQDADEAHAFVPEEIVVLDRGDGLETGERHARQPMLD